MRQPLILGGLAALATWDGWRWYLTRVAAQPEEGVALLVLVAVLGVLGIHRRREHRQLDEVTGWATWGLATALLVYAAARLMGPAILAAALAVAVTLACVYAAMFRERPPAAFWGLVMLALPVLPSLQFTLGYPMRVVSAALTVGLLRLQGLSIEREGTFLRWRGEMVQFDAPCSGINMLWAGLLLTLLGAVVLRLGVMKLAAAIAVCVLATIAANVLRAASLFYVEAGVLSDLTNPAPAWWHEGAGLAAFALSSAAVAWTLRRLQDREAGP